MKKDSIFAEPMRNVTDFKFDQKVANVFPDMIKRSIPGYSSLVSNIGVVADYFYQENTNVYDLGCSLGAVSQSIRHRIRKTGCTIYAIDNSVEMLIKAKTFLEIEDYPIDIKFIHDDVCSVIIENASVIVLNFTMQFISPKKRTFLIKRIYEGLRPNGVLILSEKIRFNAPKQQLMDNIHQHFKRDQGYTDLEISQKRSSLENVMKLDDLETHLDRLRLAGFKNVEQWFNCLNFSSFMAIK